MRRTLEEIIEIAVAKAVVDSLFPGFVPYSSIVAELLLLWEPKGPIDSSGRRYYSNGQHAKFKACLNYHREMKRTQNHTYYSRRRVR